MCYAPEVSGGTKISQLSGGEIDVFYVSRKGGWTSLRSSGLTICLILHAVRYDKLSGTDIVVLMLLYTLKSLKTCAVRIKLY